MDLTPLLSNAGDGHDKETLQFLISNYTPTMHRKSIYAIDYDSVKLHGVKLISFDIDETIAGDDDKDPPKTAITLMENLKKKGFIVILISNANTDRAKHFGKVLDIDYIGDAKKPLTKYFDKVLIEHKLKPTEMMHVGNSLLDDVSGGNSAGIRTCWVDNVSKEMTPDERKLLDTLIERDIFIWDNYEDWSKK